MIRIAAPFAVAFDLPEMPHEPATVADLRETGIISTSEIVAAINHYVVDSTAGPYRFTSGHTIDVAAAVAASSEAFGFQNRRGPHEKVLRSAIATIVTTAQVPPPKTAG